jgi:membrane-bound ClpP family serine protease
MDIAGLITHMTPFAASCFGLGVLLLLVEMIHPGFGIPGLTGIFLLFLGVFLAARTWSEVLALTLIILGLIGIALSFVFNSAKNGFVAKKLILHNKSIKESGYVAVNDSSRFLAKEGRSLTILRPAGKANFDEETVDVISEGEFIPADTPIQVIKVEGGRIVVRSVN